MIINVVNWSFGNIVVTFASVFTEEMLESAIDNTAEDLSEMDAVDADSTVIFGVNFVFLWIGSVLGSKYYGRCNCFWYLFFVIWPKRLEKRCIHTSPLKNVSGCQMDML